MKTVAIFLAGQNGDILSAASMIHYRKELWGDCKIIWFLERGNFDLLKYQDIELREFPRGFGYPQMVAEENAKLIAEGKEPIWEDWAPLVDENNHLRIDLLDNYPSLQGIDVGYFPAPHQMTVSQRHGIYYPNCSKKCFDVPMEWEWHPVLKFSDEEKYAIGKWFPPYNGIYEDQSNRQDATKRVAIETFAGSGQSKLNDAQVRSAMQLCRQILGECYFIFVSHKYLNGQEIFPDDIENMDDVFFANEFSVRQCGLIVSHCDLLISVSSGITCAALAWGLEKIPVLQYCGSGICSTSAMAKGRIFELVTTDERLSQVAEADFMLRLESMLKSIK